MDDQRLFEQFHSAYDIEPRAGSFDLLRATLMRIEVRPRRRAWLGFQVPRLSARLLAAALLVAVAFASAGAFIAINQYVHQTIPAKPHRSSPYTIPSPPAAAAGCSSVPRQWASYPVHPAKMLSATTGWAYGPMRTTDGGANWLDVSPPSIPGRTNKNDEFFLDATHAWVAETAASVNKCVDHIVVLRTADAGRTWQEAAPIPVRFAFPTDVIWTGHANHASWLDFVDPMNGWLLLGSGPGGANGSDSAWVGADWRVGDLYRTADGGLHWTHVATNPGSAAGCIPAPINELHASAVSFSSPTTGWILTTCGLLVTHDGGLAWAKSVTPLVPKEVPVFFDPRHGLIFVDGGLLVTSDGGGSWSVRAAPVGVQPIDFSTLSDGWAMGNGDDNLQCNLPDLGACSRNYRLYQTSDGGRTWTPGNFTSLGMLGLKFWPPLYLHFVDPKTGFAATGEDPREAGLFRTTDAGRTWTLVDGTVEGP
jgi:photosystem II stability/assembly factor-like uncharacterized protein